MELRYIGFSHTNNALKDIANYDKISDYLQAVLNYHKDNFGTLNFIPINCGYIADHRITFIIRSGFVVEDAQKEIDLLKTLYAGDNCFTTENLVISINGKDKEVWFGWR